MFRLQPFAIGLNKRAITGNDIKSKGNINFDNSKLYSKFLNEKFFYKEMYDEDVGNQKMRKLNLEELFGSVISLELLAPHLLTIMAHSFNQIKEKD